MTRAKRIAIGGLVVIAAWAIWKIANGNRFPNGFKGRNTEPADWVYPISDTADWVSAIVIELLVLAAMLAPGTSPAGRAVVLGALSLLVGIVIIPLGMHASLGFGMHAFWLLIAGAWLVGFGIVATLAAREKPELPTAILR